MIFICFCICALLCLCLVHNLYVMQWPKKLWLHSVQHLVSARKWGSFLQFWFVFTFFYFIFSVSFAFFPSFFTRFTYFPIAFFLLGWVETILFTWTKLEWGNIERESTARTKQKQPPHICCHQTFQVWITSDASANSIYQCRSSKSQNKELHLVRLHLFIYIYKYIAMLVSMEKSD